MNFPESEDSFLSTCSMPLHSHEETRPRHPTVKLTFFHSHSEESEVSNHPAPKSPSRKICFPNPLGPCFIQAWLLRCPLLLSRESGLVPGSHPPVLHKAFSVPRANPLVR